MKVIPFHPSIYCILVGNCHNFSLLIWLQLRCLATYTCTHVLSSLFSFEQNPHPFILFTLSFLSSSILDSVFHPILYHWNNIQSNHFLLPFDLLEQVFPLLMLSRLSILLHAQVIFFSLVFSGFLLLSFLDLSSLSFFSFPFPKIPSESRLSLLFAPFHNEINNR